MLNICTNSHDDEKDEILEMFTDGLLHRKADERSFHRK